MSIPPRIARLRVLPHLTLLVLLGCGGDEVYNAAPVPRFIVVPPSGPLGTVFVFDPTGSTDAEDPPSALSMRWDFDNDGSWDTALAPLDTIQHRYPSEGHKTARLRVRDRDGRVAEVLGTVDVGVGNTPPNAICRVEPADGPYCQLFTLDASQSTDGQDPLEELQVRWDWDADGSWDTPFAVEKTVTHLYESPGAKTVRLEVLDRGGLSSLATGHVMVQPNAPPEVAPLVVGGLEPLLLAGESLTLAAGASDAACDVLSYSWSVEGPGSLDSETGEEVGFTAGDLAGECTLTVRVSDGELEGVGTLTLWIADGLSGDLAASTIWTAADGPLLVVEDLRVPAGVSLTLDEGVEVVLRPRSTLEGLVPVGLEIQGSLTARGSGQHAMVVFRPPVGYELPGHAGVRFTGAGEGELRQVWIQDATVAVTHEASGAVSLRDAVIEGGQIGYLGRAGSEGELRRVAIEGLAGVGIRLEGARVSLSDCRLTGNLGGGVEAVDPVAPVSPVTLATLDGCQLDQNGVANLVLVDYGWVTLDGCNLIPAAGAFNVLFQGAIIEPLASTPLLLTGSYWGLSPVQSEAEIAELTFSGTTGDGDWLRLFDLSGYVLEPLTLAGP